MRSHLDDSLCVKLECWHDLVAEAPYEQVPVPTSHSALGSALYETDVGPSLIKEKFSETNSVLILCPISRLTSHPTPQGAEHDGALYSRDVAKKRVCSEDPQVEPSTRLSCPLLGS